MSDTTWYSPWQHRPLEPHTLSLILYITVAENTVISLYLGTSEKKGHQYYLRTESDRCYAALSGDADSQEKILKI